MKVTLNGVQREFEDNITIKKLLEEINMHPQRVAVEVNREIVKRDKYDSHQLHDGDEIEVLQFVGGGKE